MLFLDDDTLCHRDLLTTLLRHLDRDAMVVSQERTDGQRRLKSEPESAVQGRIDIGQAIMRRGLIGDDRIPETYEGDGAFLELVLARGEVAFVDEVLSVYNQLRPDHAG